MRGALTAVSEIKGSECCCPPHPSLHGNQAGPKGHSGALLIFGATPLHYL